MWPAVMMITIVGAALCFALVFQAVEPIWLIVACPMVQPLWFISVLQMNCNMIARVVRLFDFWLLWAYLTTFVVTICILFRTHATFSTLVICGYPSMASSLFADASTPGGRVHGSRFAFTFNVFVTGAMLTIVVFSLLSYTESVLGPD